MKKCFFILAAALIAFGTLLVSCNANVEAPAEELVSISFENGSARALSSNLEGFAPETYYWKYAAKKADSSNLVSGETATYDEARAKWIKEGSQGLGTPATQTTPYESYKVQGFSQGLWNFKLFAYKDVSTTETPDYRLVYSGETTGVLLQTNGNHRVDVVVSPAQTGNGTLIVKITGDDKIVLNPASGTLIPNTKIRLGIEKIVGATTTPVRTLGFIDADYSNDDLEPGTYKVTVQFTNDDATVIYAAGSVVSTVYSNLTTTIKGSLNEVVTYADFSSTQNPDIITTTIGTAAITQGTTSSTVNFTSTTETKVTASMPTAAAQSLIATMEQELDAKTSTSTSTTSNLTLNLSVNTTEATETTITYEIGMEATLVYEKIDAQSSEKTTTKSTVEQLDDFVTVVIDMQAGLTDVSVTHSGNDMTSGEQWAEKTSRTTLELSDFLANAGKEANPDPDGYYYYYEYSSNNSTVKDKATLYIKTKTFSPFKLSYTVPEAVAAIGSTTYTTLEAAVSDAVNGDTVILLKNVSVGARIIVDKTITLDLNGNTITGTENKKDAPIFVIGGESTGDLKIIGTTAGSAINAKATAVFVNANSKLAVNGGSYSNSYYDPSNPYDPKGSYIFDVQGTATIDSVTLTGVVKGVRAEGTGSNVTVSNSSADVMPGAATGDYVGKGWGLFGSDMGRLTIESGTYKTTYAAARQMIDIKNDGIVTINGGSFTTCLKEGTELDPIPALVVFNGGPTSADNGNKLTINGGTFTYGGKLGRVNATDNHEVVSITGGTFNASSVTIDGEPGLNDTQYNLEYTISGGLYYTNPNSDPSAKIAVGYIAAPQGTYPETWIVKKRPDAPMAKVIRYVADKTDSDEMAHATITSAEVVTLDLVSEMKEIMRALPVTEIDLTSDDPFADYTSLIAAIQTGTLVTFMPKFDAAGKTVGDLPESDAYYCGVNIDNVDSWDEFKDTTFAGWRTDFRIITEDTFGENEISLVGYYYFRDNDGNVILNTGCQSIDNIGPKLGIGEKGAVSVMNDLFGGFFAIPYDLLLGACSTMDGVRYGFNCGAYAMSDTPILQQKQITVQLILTNDNLPGVVEPETVVCAEVVCTFHAPDTYEDTLMLAVLSQLDDSNQLKVSKDDGSEQDEYMSLAEFRENVNGGNAYYGYTATLMENVDLVGSVSNQWIPIGNSGTTPFKGTFDGAGHTISGLFIKTNIGADSGLFGYVEDATIRNLTVDGTIVGYDGAAGVVCKAHGNTVISNVVNSVDVTAYRKVGGIICAAYPNRCALGSDRKDEQCVITIDSCTNEGTLECLGIITADGSNPISGAIVGFVSKYGQVVCTGCTNAGTLKATQSILGSGTVGQPGVGYVVGWCMKGNPVNYESNGVYITNCTNSGADNLIMVDQNSQTTKASDIIVGYAGSCGTGYKVFVRNSGDPTAYTVIAQQQAVKDSDVSGN